MNFWARRESTSTFMQRKINGETTRILRHNWYTSPLTKGSVRKYNRQLQSVVVFPFQRRAEVERYKRKALDELVRLSEEAGLYDAP